MTKISWAHRCWQGAKFDEPRHDNNKTSFCLLNPLFNIIYIMRSVLAMFYLTHHGTPEGRSA